MNQIVVWHFGFYRPSFRNIEGRIDPRCWFGHCDAWGCNEDGTWIFLDPQGRGARVDAMHRWDDVQDRWAAQLALADCIVRTSANRPFRFPFLGIHTCASVCGSLVGIRAYLPSSLRRKLLRQGAEVIHETERRSEGQSRPPA